MLFIIASGVIAIAVITYVLKKKPKPTHASTTQSTGKSKSDPSRSVESPPKRGHKTTATNDQPEVHTPPNREPVMSKSTEPVARVGMMSAATSHPDTSLLDATIMLIDDEPTTLDILQALL
ncbi:hypothetical protein C2W62_34425 [Candidatus Entotheonella serta]|nr:hypothetical protein C2W62_34425 [Candidatus Entotheonella serta]